MQLQQTTKHRYLSYASLLAVVMTMLSLNAFAGAGGVTGLQADVKGFFDDINSILTAISVTVVTIAFIFAGYQIAFNHKRVTDVMPVILGGVVIGAAAQFASWFTSFDGK